MKRVCQFIKPWRLGLQRKCYSLSLFASEKSIYIRWLFCRWGCKGRSKVTNCIYMFYFSSVRKIKTDITILWLSCIAKTTLLICWCPGDTGSHSNSNYGIDFVVPEQDLQNSNTWVWNLRAFTFDKLNSCAEFVYEIQNYVCTSSLSHSHNWYCAGNLHLLYWKFSLWTLVADHEDPGIQGARALTAIVLTQSSRNISVSAPEGLKSCT